MAVNTGISWTDATWNPVRGCSRVSEGCRHCYAERVAARFSDPGMPYYGLARRKLTIVNNEERDPGNKSEARWTGEVRMVPEHLADPLRWKKPRRIFVNSMSDLFHEKLTNEQIAAVFGVMAAAPQHTFQILTKRAKRMREWFEWMTCEADQARDAAVVHYEDTSDMEVRMCVVALDRFEIERGHIPYPKWPLPNVWLGVSVENQEAADERIPELLRTPAAIRFLSCEPLIGEVDLDLPLCDDFDRHGDSGYGVADDGTPWCAECDSERSFGHWLHLDGGIDWVIVGCESGPGARSCNVEWIRSLRDQCASAGVAFFAKQAVGTSNDAHHREAIAFGDGSKRKSGGVIELPYLDGVQHAAFPGASS